MPKHVGFFKTYIWAVSYYVHLLVEVLAEITVRVPQNTGNFLIGCKR